MFRKSKATNSTASPNVIVTSDSVKRRSRALSFAPAFRSLRDPANKPLLIALVVAAFVIGLPLLFYGYLRLSDLKNRDDSIVVCKQDILKEAGQAIDKNNITNTAKIAQEVQQLKEYNTDANCQYILVRYAIMTGNYDEAQKQLDQLNKVYHYHFAPEFGDHPLLPQEMQQIITDSIAAQNETNAQAADISKEQAELDQSADKLVGGKQ